MQVELIQNPAWPKANPACSLHVPELPFVFILAMASPPLPSYIHGMYQKSTLALIELEVLAVPSGPEVLDTLLLKVSRLKIM